MIKKDNFSDKLDSNVIFNQERVPVFQNKVYKTVDEAKKAASGNVTLSQSKTSGFVFNSSFDSSLMDYDENYQNEQGNSIIFQNHLVEVLNKLKNFGIQDKKIIEIGCGKGVFFKMLQQGGFNCWGYDPTYEGDDPKIIKEYFSEANNDINADVIIMRHTLEHIPNPFSFIHEIAKANDYKGMLYVEVPTFDWILKKEAFWDIFFEHCNYFTENSLASMFDSALTGDLFGGQYIYLWADLAKLRSEIPQQIFEPIPPLVFTNAIKKYEKIILDNSSIAIWGAGAKGSTFLNLLDAKVEKVKYVIDINPIKQNKFIACTSHPIYGPNYLDIVSVENILVMNENYISEIKSIIQDKIINIISL